MQQVVIDKPYQFVAPHAGRLWPALLQWYLPRFLDRRLGITRVTCRGQEHLRASLDAGHGILLAPNHCRDADPFVLGVLSRQVRHPLFVMASWHLFMQGRLQRFLLNRAGAFSIYREGTDRTALNTAVQILEQAQRPLVVFPEGVLSRANDLLNPLMDGVALMARSAAKKRAKLNPPGSVVVHPVAIRYCFRGNLEASLAPVLDQIEVRLTWPTQRHLPLYERVVKVGLALLSLKEIQYLGQPQDGPVHQRIQGLIDRLLAPLEERWCAGRQEGSLPGVPARVKRLRSAILPEMVQAQISDADRQQRWRDLSDCELAQQLSCYRADYIASHPSPDRYVETVQRFEEDLAGYAQPHRPTEAVVQVGPAIPVSPERTRGQGSDPLLQAIETQLRTMLDELAPAEAAELKPAAQLKQPV